MAALTANSGEEHAAAGSVGGLGGHQPRTDFPPFPPPRRVLSDGVELGTVKDLPMRFGRLRKLYLLDLEPVCEELLAPARPGEGVGAGGVQLNRLPAAILQKLPLVVVQHDPRPLLPLPPRARLRCQRSDPRAKFLILVLPVLPPLPPLLPLPLLPTLPLETICDQHGLVGTGKGECGLGAAAIAAPVLIARVSDEGDRSLPERVTGLLVDGALCVELELGQLDGVDGGDRELGAGGRRASHRVIAMYILFMFQLEFKPQFLNYPLDAQEYARVSLRAGEVSRELARLQAETQQLQAQPEYGSFDEDSRDRYAQYLQRLRGRAAVLAEEQKECQQVAALHLAIDGQTRHHRQDRPEVKNHLLEHYKAAIIAKRSRRAAERMREVELERRMLEDAEGLQQVGSQSAALVRSQKHDFNPESHVILDRFQEPTLGMLRFRNSQTEQKSSKTSESRKSSHNRSFKLPSISKSPPSHAPPAHPGLQLMSSPMKFSNYSIKQPQRGKNIYS